MRLQHKKLGVDVELAVLVQRHVSAFYRALRDLEGSQECKQKLGAIEADSNQLVLFLTAARARWKNAGDAQEDALSILHQLRHLLRCVQAAQLAVDDGNAYSLSIPEDRENCVKAACRAEIISAGLDEGTVSDMAPAATLWLARKIDEVLAETLTIPPE